MLRRLAALLLEGRCQACGRAVSGGSALCPGCAERLAPRLGGFCPACGALADDPAGPIVLCPTCALTPPPWDAFAFHGPYDDLLRSLLLRFKFGPDLGLCSLLRGLVVAAWERSLQDRPFDLIVPVPLHPRRLLRRGFNQTYQYRKLAGSDDVSSVGKSFDSHIHDGLQYACLVLGSAEARRRRSEIAAEKRRRRATARNGNGRYNPLRRAQ